MGEDDDGDGDQEMEDEGDSRRGKTSQSQHFLVEAKCDELVVHGEDDQHNDGDENRHDHNVVLGDQEDAAEQIGIEVFGVSRGEGNGCQSCGDAQAPDGAEHDVLPEAIALGQDAYGNGGEQGGGQCADQGREPMDAMNGLEVSRQSNSAQQRMGYCADHIALPPDNNVAAHETTCQRGEKHRQKRTSEIVEFNQVVKESHNCPRLSDFVVMVVVMWLARSDWTFVVDEVDPPLTVGSDRLHLACWAHVNGLVDADDMGDELRDQAQVMRDLQDGDGFVQVPEQVEKRRRVFLVQVCVRFVQEQEFWFRRERLRYQHALSLSARKLREWRIDVVCQSDLLEFLSGDIPVIPVKAPPGLLVDPSHQDDIERRGGEVWVEED